MFNPNKRLGEDDGEDRKKPGMTMIVGFKPEKRLGDEEEEAGAEEAEPEGDLDAQADQAAERICRIINISSAKAGQLKELIQTICIAADAKPHREGEHTDEEEN